MCGTLKFEGEAKKRGDIVAIINAKSKEEAEAQWTGFAKSERKDWWMQYGIPATVKADSIVEGSVQCEVQVPSQRLMAILLNKEVKVGGQVIGKPGQVKIFTREAKTKLEADIHERWPVSFKLRVDGRGIHFWGVHDIKESGGYKLALPQKLLEEATPIPPIDLGEPDETIPAVELNADVSV